MTRAISRRAALALPAFIAAPAAAVAVAVPGPDAELLSLCQRYMSLNRRLDRLDEAMHAANAARDKALDDRLFAIQARFMPYAHGILDEVMDLPARSPAGLRAKAAVAMTRVETSSDGAPQDDDVPLWSLCRDLLGQGAPL